MFDHLGLRTARLDASIRFYETALAPLGYRLGSRDEQSAGLGPPDAPALWIYEATGQSGSSVHLAFTAPDRQAVDRFHADARPVAHPRRRSLSKVPASLTSNLPGASTWSDFTTPSSSSIE